MAITGTQLIQRAMEVLGELQAGETPNTSESSAALIRLNALIDSYNIVQDMATAATTATQILTNTVQSYALSTRVVKIVSAEVQQSGGATMPLNIVDAVTWDKLPDRDSLSPYPQNLFYDRGFTTGTIYLSPIPTGGTLTYVCWIGQSTFATLGTSNTLLPGYERLLTTALAIELAPIYQRPVTDELKASYTEAMNEVRNLNKSLWGMPKEVAA